MTTEEYLQKIANIDTSRWQINSVDLSYAYEVAQYVLGQGDKQSTFQFDNFTIEFRPISSDYPVAKYNRQEKKITVNTARSVDMNVIAHEVVHAIQDTSYNSLETYPKSTRPFVKAFFYYTSSSELEVMTKIGDEAQIEAAINSLDKMEREVVNRVVDEFDLITIGIEICSTNSLDIDELTDAVLQRITSAKRILRGG